MKCKYDLEHFARQHGIKIKSYHADNHPFTSKEFLADIECQEQTISLSGVGAHHQNAIAERAIQTVFAWTRAQMLHQLIHWPEQFDKANWPFALEHSINVWNNMPRTQHGQTPLELFTGLKSPNRHLLNRVRVWGSPCYVLDPRLQDNKKIPKFSKRSRMGMYVGFSDQHSTTVGCVLNLQTGSISPQYHIIHDEEFTTVTGRLDDELFDSETWNTLIERDPPINNVDPNDIIDGHPPFERLYDDFVNDNNPDHPSQGSVGEVQVENTSDHPDFDHDHLISDLDSHDPFDFVNDKPQQTPKVYPKEPYPMELRKNTRSGKSYKSTTFSLGNFIPRSNTNSIKRSEVERNRYLAGGVDNSKVRNDKLDAQFVHSLSWKPSSKYEHVHLEI